MKKILIILGTRPEAIKMAPLIKKLRKEKKFKVTICATAQHRQMLDQVLEIFEIKPDLDLNIMRNNQDLFKLSSQLIMKMDRVLEQTKPHIVLVQGDTTSTLIASLAAFYKKIKIGHVEAGLRSQNKYSPFTEEMNRKLVSALSDLHFAPTQKAGENLITEGISEKNIFVTGNTVIDAIIMIEQKINEEKISIPALKLKADKLLLVTAHRRESFGEGFKNICSALSQIAKNNPDIDIVYPVHLNPNVQLPVKKILSSSDNIHLIKPLGYIPFVILMKKAYFILTDSGGIQEEAAYLGKPILVMREVTERTEGIEAGVSKLIGNKKENIVHAAESLLHNRNEYKKMARAVNVYGDGKAAEKICGILKKYL